MEPHPPGRRWMDNCPSARPGSGGTRDWFQRGIGPLAEVSRCLSRQYPETPKVSEQRGGSGEADSEADRSHFEQWSSRRRGDREALRRCPRGRARPCRGRGASLPQEDPEVWSGVGTHASRTGVELSTVWRILRERRPSRSRRLREDACVDDRRALLGVRAQRPLRQGRLLRRSSHVVGTASSSIARFGKAVGAPPRWTTNGAAKRSSR